MSTIFIVALISLMIKHQNAVSDKLSFGSTRGCDSACQKECIEVINKYRINHQAKEVIFSQYLADKAQKWADGGTFGYDMKSRGKYGQLIEWDVKNEMRNFTTVIKHWHDKERDFDFAASRSRTGKTLHDFTQIVWKKARKAGCAQSEIFGSRYYVVWMDSDGVVNPNMEVGEENIGTPKKGDLHWFESSVNSSKKKPIHLMPSRLREETSLTRTFAKTKGPKISTTAKVRSDQSKPITAPDLSEVQEEQRVLNNNAMLKQYLYQDSLNNVVLNENKETASYHVVPGAKENANWQKGAESLIQLDKNKPNSSSEKQNDGMAAFPVEADDDRKQAARFQSLVIQDDDMLTKDEEDYNGTLSSERNGGDELGEGDENKQATAIQSMMKQEDDMIQNENDEEDEESSGNISTADTDASSNGTNRKVSSNDMTSRSSKITTKLSEKPTSYYTSGVALNNVPNEYASSEPNKKPSTDSTGDNSNSSVHVNGMTNHLSVDNHQESLNESSPNNNLNSGQNEQKDAGLTEPASTALSQNDKPGSQQVRSNHSMSQSIKNEAENNQTEIKMSNTTGTSANNGGKAVRSGSVSNVLTSENELQMASKSQNGSVARMPNSRLADVINQAKTENQEGKIPYDSHAQVMSPHSQQPVATMSTASDGRKNQDLKLVSSSFAQSGQTEGQNIASPSTDENAIASSTSVSDIHHVTSPAVITLPSASSRPIKLIFHVKDMKSKGTFADGSETISTYQPTTAGDDITTKMNDNECHDDTLQCHLWAHHGHCKGIAYAEFMKRHCKATCGYCSFPSVIKESAKHVQTSSLSQDEPCEDTPSYEFSCPRWQVQGYCEKREKEMKLVCRKTCGFCVLSKSKSRPSSSFHPLPGSVEPGGNALSDKSNSNTQISQQFTVSQSKPNLNEILKNKATSTPIFHNQYFSNSPIKPPKKNFTLQNSSGLPEWSSLGSAMMNQKGNLNAKNTSEVSPVSTHDFGNETTLGTTGNSTIKDNKEKAGLHNPYQPLLKQSGATTNQANKTKITDQMEVNTPSPPKAHEPGMTNKLKNFIKAPVKVDFQSLSTFKPQVAAASSFAKTVPNQQFISQQEDEIIENGIKALQHRLQAPLEISAVAKSAAGCGRRLCKEKSKTQQAKTRENIGNRVSVSGVSLASKTKNGLVSTKGCDASCQQECLAAHNRYRLNHGATALVLDQTLANQAQQWADKKLFKHSPWAGGQGGETIALGSLYPSFIAAVKAWHDEEKDYDWATGKGQRGMKVNHFTQVVWKGAHLLGCGKTVVNGEPYYIAQMDTPGVIAGEPGFDKSNVGQPKEPDLLWFMNSSPYWKEMQTKDSIPKNIEHRIL